MTVPFAHVIGDPIAHSKSPQIHRFWLEKLGLQAHYDRHRVVSEGLGDYFVQRRTEPAWRGCNVTIPHKEAVQPFLDVVEPAALAIGAVNTVFRGDGDALYGTNTDIDGVGEALAQAEPDGPAVVIGNGGAARAAFAYLVRRGGSDVRILARDPDKAVRVAKSCDLGAKAFALDPSANALQGASMVINATQLGMHGQAPMPEWICEHLERTAPSAVVFDMVYAPLETAFLSAARASGRNCADGLAMLVGQAAAAFERFFGAPPPREHDRQLREILVR